jgi:hypothetical protein
MEDRTEETTSGTSKRSMRRPCLGNDTRKLLVTAEMGLSLTQNGSLRSLSSVSGRRSRDLKAKNKSTDTRRVVEPVSL